MRIRVWLLMTGVYFLSDGSGGACLGMTRMASCRLLLLLLLLLLLPLLLFFVGVRGKSNREGNREGSCVRFSWGVPRRRRRPVRCTEMTMWHDEKDGRRWVGRERSVGRGLSPVRVRGEPDRDVFGNIMFGVLRSW